jgi:hypothetical protein
MKHRRPQLQDNDTDDQESTPFIQTMPNRSNSPSALELLSLSPAKYGYLLKRNNTFLARLCPCLYPKYKRRFFVLIGSFLFRYEDENSDHVKGIPIPLDSIRVTSLGENANDEEFGIQLQSLRKNYTILASSLEERDEWISAIRLRKSAALREDMKHAPVSEAIQSINRKADSIYKKRLAADSSPDETFNPLQPLGFSSSSTSTSARY